MPDNITCLLSIIIPTKNRQYTCLYTITSALLIESDNIEVIIQDCSDTDILKQQIFNKIGNDPRIKYYHTDSLPSMTENWNLAISHATGKYICVIGDDDAILPYCLEFTKWMEKNHVQAGVGVDVKYVWKDAAKGSYTSGRLSYSKYYSGKIYEIDVQKEFKKKVLNCGFGYTNDLTNIYHGIVEKKLLELHKKNCGHYLSGTSVDVYNAIVMPHYLKKSFYVDYPLTIKGVSASSNSNRVYSRSGTNIHLSEYKNFKIPTMLPTALNADVSVAESTLVALKDTHQEELIPKMNLDVLYAKCAAIDLLNFFNYLKQYRQRKNTHNTDKNFFFSFYKVYKHNLTAFFRNIALKSILSLLPTIWNFLNRYSKKSSFSNPDMLSAHQMLQQHLTTTSLTIKYDGRLERFVSKKMYWE